MPNTSSSNPDLERVSVRIAGAIKSFCRTRVQTNPVFFMSDMVRYVSSYPGLKVAPNSPARIFQQMKKNGQLNYMVINRSKSLYRINEVA